MIWSQYSLFLSFFKTMRIDNKSSVNEMINNFYYYLFFGVIIFDLNNIKFIFLPLTVRINQN